MLFVRTFFSLAPSTNVKYAVTRVLRYPPDKLYDIVSNVNDYEKFIPFITSSRVNSSQVVSSTTQSHRSHGPQKVTKQQASLSVGAESISFAYESKVTLEELISGVELYRVTATSNDHQMFKSLNAYWTIAGWPSGRPIPNDVSKLTTEDLERLLLSPSGTRTATERNAAASLVRYEMDVDFRHFLVAQLWSANISRTGIESFIDAFENRAFQLLSNNRRS